jgi:tetratricopeptide (TPR) repeat protein
MNDELPDVAHQIAHFEARLRNDPGSRVFLPLADLYRRAGELEHARELLERGLARHPAFVAAQTALGLVHAELGDGAAAREVLDRVLMRDADNVLARRILLQEAIERGDWLRAREIGERLLRLAPDDSTVQDRVQEARRQLESGPEAGPVEPEPIVAPSDDEDPPASEDYRAFETPTLAELYLRQGHHDKARAIVKRILSAEPDRQDAQKLLERIETPDNWPPTSSAAPDSADDRKVARGAAASLDEDAVAARPLRPSVRSSAGEARELDRFRTWLDTAAGGE